MLNSDKVDKHCYQTLAMRLKQFRKDIHSGLILSPTVYSESKYSFVSTTNIFDGGHHYTPIEESAPKHPNLNVIENRSTVDTTNVTNM